MGQNAVNLEIKNHNDKEGNEKSIAHIALDDGKVNALSPQLVADLSKTLDEAESADVVLLSGNQKVFSAGFDLKVIRDGDTEEESTAAKNLMRDGVNLFNQIFSYPKPVVVACTGHAIAGGAIMLMCSDLRVGPENTDISIGLNEVAIGMEIPPFLIEIANVRLANEKRYEALNLARLYNTEEAKSVGFLDITAKDVLDTALAEAKNIIDHLDPVAFTKSKQRLRGATSERIKELNAKYNN